MRIRKCDRNVYDRYETLYPIKRITCCVSIIIFLISLEIIVVATYTKHSSWLLHFSFVLVTACILAMLREIFDHPPCITIRNNQIHVYDVPMFYLIKTFHKKQGLLSYNNEIVLNEVVKIELVVLTKKEQKTYVAFSNRFSNKYLKFNLKYDNCKFVYVGNYTNHQIRRLLGLQAIKETE